MSTIHDYIIRISTSEGYGGGFIFSPTSDSSLTYILTARHCLADNEDNPLKKEDILIEFLISGEWQSYTLKETDIILLGGNFKTEDIGLIIIPSSIVPASIDLKSAPSLSAHPANSLCPEITGFPKAVLNERKRTLYRLNIVEDRDYENEIQIEVADAITGHYNSDNLVEGYSGSPVLLKTKTADCVCGIFRSYEQTTKRILAIDLHLINNLLENYGNDTLPLQTIETNQHIINAIKRLDTNSERVLKRIRNKVGTVNLERSALTSELIQTIFDSKFTIVSGKPGVGKSAIVKMALHQLGENRSVIALQGEQLDKKSLVEIFRQDPFEFVPELESVLDSNYYTTDKILLIDSIEKLLETKNADTILDFFELVNKREDIKIVMTCRSYAVESLKIRFLRQFPVFGDFNIPVLSAQELKEVEATYPDLQPLLAKQSLFKLLEIPFNLDLAANLANRTFMEDVDSEMAFRKIMWDYVIENRISEADVSIKKLRGEVFMLIAIERTVGMSTYAFIDTQHDTIIEELFRDGIIDKEPKTGKGYAASHDIFEDWALERHIEENFQRYAIAEGRYDNFYTTLDTTPGIRRAFRIWFSEKMQIVDPQANNLLTSTLLEKEVDNYWKDEILVAVMQSSYSKIFLEENKAFLFSDNFKYFERAIFVLKVACQKLDLTYLNFFTPEKKTMFYHNVNLIPFGDGWCNMINFINENISSLENEFPVIINMILQWKKGINDQTLPQESKKVGLILLAYFKSFETNDKDYDHYSRIDSSLEDCLRLMFWLSKELLEEVKTLITQAFKNKPASENYRLKKLYSTIIKFVISGDESKIICNQYPELVIEILEEKWFYYPPSEEEIKKREKEHPFAFTGIHENRENSFGIKSKSDFRYFPASPYQTPIQHLLVKKPLQTLDFIVKFLNHCTIAYLQSTYDTESNYLIAPSDRTEFELRFADGTITTQHASATLWIMYRGTYIAVPDLIESVLMALEQFLLTLAGVIEKKIITNEEEPYMVVWDAAFEKLLKESNNVMGSAVLMSLAIAYSELGAEKVLPLLRCKEIYNWDIIRAVRESSALSPIGTSRNAIEHQKLLYKFQKLDHRKKLIRDFVLNLSQGRLAPEIHKIIDELYNDPKGDDQWRLTVTNMDLRKYVPTKKVAEGYIFEAVVDESLRPMVEEHKKYAEESAVLSTVSSWSFNKSQNKPIEDDRYEKWQDVLKITKEFEDNTKINKLENQPGLVAGIGIRDYFESLDSIEKEWCVEKLRAIIEYDLYGANNKIEGFIYTPMETEIAYSVLPRLMHLSEGEIKSDLKKNIFLALISYHGKMEKKTLYKSFYTYLWKNDPDFMIKCIIGLYKYSTFSRLLHSTAHIEISTLRSKENQLLSFVARIIKFFIGTKNQLKTEVNQEELSHNQKIIDVRRKYHDIIISIGTSEKKPALNIVSLDDVSIDMIFEILKLIPYDTNNSDLQHFCLLLLNHILYNLNKKDSDYGDDYERFNHESLQNFGEFAAKYMLHQQLAVAEPFFEVLISATFEISTGRRIRSKSHDFIAQRLEDLHLAFLADEFKSANYWMLFEKFIAKCTQTKAFAFDKQLLFNHYMFDSFQFNWIPLAGKKQLFMDFIGAGANLDYSIKFISGIGFTEMMPDAVELIAARVTIDLMEHENSYYFDKLIIQAYHDSFYRKALQRNSKFRNAFIEILDSLINISASSSAYIIREDFIFSKSQS